MLIVLSNYIFVRANVWPASRPDLDLDPAQMVRAALTIMRLWPILAQAYRCGPIITTGPWNGSDYVVALAVDGSGNVFVTGESSNGRFLDYATIKYSAAPLFPIPLNYQIVGNQLVLSWTNAAFTLQSAPAVQGSYTNIPGATTSHSAPFPEGQRYFRLKGNY